MSDVSGIPNMGFGGGSYFGGNAATGQPAWSAAQINASMGLPQAQAAQQQAMASLYGGGSFGAQPAYYAALGAAYGRQVPLSAAAMGSSQADRIRAIYGAGALGPGQNVPTSYGSMHNEGAPVPSPYRAPMSYGWGHNEGAPAPAAPSYYPMGQFRPQTYGWDHNEGAVPGYIGGGPGNMLSPQPMGPQSSAGQNWYGMPTASS
jgi:hypothetical protein